MTNEPNKVVLETFLYNGVTFLVWQGLSDHSTLLIPKGVVELTKEVQWPKLQVLLEQGVPTPIGLLNTSGGIGAAHQVVATGFSTDGTNITINIYDNNYPDNDQVTIGSTVDLWANPHWNETTGDIWRGFFVEQGYSPVKPPYFDLVSSDGLHISADSVVEGQPFAAAFSVANVGEYTGHGSLCMMLDGGQLMAGPMTDIPAGGSSQLSFNTASFESTPGSHFLEATYESLEGRSISLPQQLNQQPGPNSADFTVFAAPSVAVTVSGSTPYFNLDKSGSVASAGYMVQVTGTVVGSGFAPSSYQWSVDDVVQAGASGVSASLAVEVFNSSRPGQYTYAHTICLTASNAQTGQLAEATYDLTCPKPSVVLEPAFSLATSKAGASSTFKYQTGETTVTAYSAVTVLAALAGFLGETTLEWTPKPVAAGSSDGLAANAAVFDMTVNGDPDDVNSYSGYEVTCTVQDVTGQTAEGTLMLPALQKTGAFWGVSVRPSTGLIPSQIGPGEGKVVTVDPEMGTELSLIDEDGKPAGIGLVQQAPQAVVTLARQCDVPTWGALDSSD
jgi:hypothetical protein